MAHVEDRWEKVVDGRRVRTDRFGKGLRWTARHREAGGRERKQSFARKVDAEGWLAEVEVSKRRGAYFDPSAGRETLEEYAKKWLAAQTFDESTREATELRLRLHVYPHLGAVPLVALKSSRVQAWNQALQATLSPRYVRVIMANLSAVLSAAVDDECIVRNPCSAGSVRAPKLDERPVMPWTAAAVAAVGEALPDRFALMVALGAGLGLRQGEIFGLAVEDVDFLRDVVHVRRQVKILAGRQVFALPKGRKVRDVPLPESVKLTIAAHLERWPAAAVPLPWQTTSGEPVTARLLLSTRERTALQRNYVNAHIWKPALRKAGLVDDRSNGMHALRHFYASVLLDAGESVRALADYLGHSDPGFTLRVYTHLMPSSQDRTRKAIDAAFGDAASVSRDPAATPGAPKAL